MGKAREPDVDVVRILEAALVRAKKGELTNVGIIARTTEHTYWSEFGGRGGTALMNAAQCFEIGIRMLGFQSKGE